MMLSNKKMAKMPDKKPTDNEIIAMVENAYVADLINCLQAEKEDYKALYEGLKAEHIETIKAIKHYKAEAYKECIEKVKAFYKENKFAYEAECMCEELDNILKEMECNSNE